MKKIVLASFLAVSAVSAVYADSLRFTADAPEYRQTQEGEQPIPLDASEIQGYKLYQTDPSGNVHTFDFDEPAGVIPLNGYGTHALELAAIDTFGQEGGRATLDFPYYPSAPEAPTFTRVTVERCDSQGDCTEIAIIVSD